MPRPRILVAHPRLLSAGGGNVMAAWTLQALCSEFDVTFATLGPIDYQAINVHFGTSLQEGDFEVRIAPPRYWRFLRSMPTPGALLEICLAMRWAQDVDREGNFDLVYSTSNEMDFHRRGVQYVNYPWYFLPRPKIEMSWFHYIPGVLAAYRKICIRVARTTPVGLRRNLMLANSKFVAGEIKKAHGTSARVVYPPVPGNFLDVPFDQRRFAMAAVGRVHPGKRWDMAVEIVEAVRRCGHPLELTLIGHPDDIEYGQKLESLAKTRPWFRWIRNATRNELLAELSRHKYGIHTMTGEHFGIAPAELQRSGCISFVHNSGGQVEIVGNDRRLTFDGVEDAAERIARVIENPAMEWELRAQVAQRKASFTEKRFCESVREVAWELVESGTYAKAGA